MGYKKDVMKRMGSGLVARRERMEVMTLKWAKRCRKDPLMFVPGEGAELDNAGGADFWIIYGVPLCCNIEVTILL